MATGGVTAQSEWLALQRRYHARLLTPDDELPPTASSSSKSTFARLFMRLTDPDLPPTFAGETELQLELPADYPEREPALDLAGFRSRLSAHQFRAIDDALKTRARELRGTLSLRKLLTWLDNNFYPLMMAADAKSDDSRENDEREGKQTNKVEEANAAIDESSEVVIAPPDESVEPAVTPEQAAKKDKRKTTRKKKDPSTTLCKFFLRQSCKSGEQCKFSHAIRVKEQKTHDEQDLEAAGTLAPDEASNATSPALQGDAASTPNPTSRKTKPAQKEDKISNPSPVEKAKKARKAKKPRVCKFFANDTCREGEKCKFLHEKESKDAVSSASQQPEKPKGIVIKVLKAPTPLESTSQQPTSDAQKPADPSSIAPPSSDDWSEAQQKALDNALKKYPATLDKKIRWLSIASEIDGKSLNECIDRFKKLCQLVRDEQPSAGESTHENNKSVEDGGSADSRVTDKRIIPVETRTAIQTEPEQKGAQIRLDELFLHQIGTLVPHRLVCQVQCTNCPLKLDASLALDAPSIRKWCPRCSVLHLVHLRPVFAHTSSSVVAYVDTNENCAIVDVVPSDLLATCLECGNEVLFPSVTPTRRSEHACFSCHTKLALMTKRYVVGQFSTESGGKTSSKKNAPSSTSSPTAKKSAPKRIVENFVLGQPLPNKGACEHYRHSYRWFRFQCCGKAFPCDVCHDRSDCAEANTGKIASRMICGLCSKEQSSAIKECACGNEVGRKKVTSSHWEGGAGCRDPNRMSPTDRKKYRGLNKTGSKKHNRVGLAAKQARRESE